MLPTKLPLFSPLLQLCEINDLGLSSLGLGFVDSVGGHKQQICEFNSKFYVYALSSLRRKPATWTLGQGNALCIVGNLLAFLQLNWREMKGYFENTYLSHIKIFWVQRILKQRRKSPEWALVTIVQFQNAGVCSKSTLFVYCSNNFSSFLKTPKMK